MYQRTLTISKPSLGCQTPVTSKAPNQDLKDMDVLCTFKLKMESQNLDHGCVTDQRRSLYQDSDSYIQSGTSSMLQSCIYGLSRHGGPLQLQNHDRKTNFGKLVFQSPVTISKSRSICKIQVRNLGQPPMLQIST